MRKRAKDESRVESDDGIEETLDETRVSVLLPDLDPQRTYKVMSPHLVHPEEAKDFFKELVEESADGP
jgi:hypothetical protein